MTTLREDDPQRERALRSWELVVLDAGSDTVMAALGRIVRVKRFEREAIAARLPGAVRQGARVDLEPLAEALTAAGVRCRVRRRNPLD